MIKFPDFSLTFPDISSQNLWSIDPRSVSNTKQNARYFSLQYSYHNYDNYVLHYTPMG